MGLWSQKNKGALLFMPVLDAWVNVEGSRREPTRELKPSGGDGGERMVGLNFRWEGDQCVRRQSGGGGLGSKAIGITDPFLFSSISTVLLALGPATSIN